MKILRDWNYVPSLQTINKSHNKLINNQVTTILDLWPNNFLPVVYVRKIYYPAVFFKIFALSWKL